MFKLNTNLCFSFDFLFCMLTLSCLEFLDNRYMYKFKVVRNWISTGLSRPPCLTFTSWTSWSGTTWTRTRPTGRSSSASFNPILFVLPGTDVLFSTWYSRSSIFCYASKAMYPKLYTMILYCASASLWKMPDSNLGPLPQQSGALAMSDYMFFFYPINARQKIMSNFGQS